MKSMMSTIAVLLISASYSSVALAGAPASAQVDCSFANLKKLAESQQIKKIDEDTYQSQSGAECTLEDPEEQFVVDMIWMTQQGSGSISEAAVEADKSSKSQVSGVPARGPASVESPPGVRGN